MFTATRLQIATYLGGVALFSIASLVFLNSSVSFVITDLIGREDGVGDAVGTLGFADELLAIFACPLWGLLSDRIGVRWVCVTGYSIIALSLVLFVQARDVYPQLLLGRLLFSLGASAASTMVTAILPAMSYVSTPGRVFEALDTHATDNSSFDENGHTMAPSQTSDRTITPARLQSAQPADEATPAKAPINTSVSTSQIAGWVGLFTGCGALLALSVFLPLPARFQKAGYPPGDSLKLSFYIVAGFAFALAIICFIGLRHLASEEDKITSKDDDDDDDPNKQTIQQRLTRIWKPLYIAFLAGFQNANIGVGYCGGFVARSSSVAITLFIPLLVNALFLSSGLCDSNKHTDTPAGLPDIKRQCPRAYVLAAELTGVSQLVALIFAPIYGYLSAKSPLKHLPLMLASVTGMIGYPLFATQFSPDDSNRPQRIVAFVAVCLIGISQIGAIVCSLGTLSYGVLEGGVAGATTTTASKAHPSSTTVDAADDGLDGEENPLMGTEATVLPTNSTNLKGSIAGVYSFYGGVAILLLTKAGGWMFDRVSTGSPFYIMAGFNGVLLAACLVTSLRT